MSNPNAGKVVSFTNITNEDFSHPYDGTPYLIPAGQTVQFPYHLGRHLAKHLSRKILLSGDKGATQYDPKDTTAANGNGTVLWNEDSENKLIEKILGEVSTHEVAKPKTEMELMREQIAELNKMKDEFLSKNHLSEPKTEMRTDPEGFKDKGQLIEELKKLGLPVDARKSKASLEAQLKEAKATA